MRNLIIVSAPSGTGKTTICKVLQERDKTMNFPYLAQLENLGLVKKMELIISLLILKNLKMVLKKNPLLNGKRFMEIIIMEH